MTFEELIKKIQKDSGLTQEDFADSIQITRKTFFNWVKGTHLPLETDIVLQIISDVYNKPMPVLSKALQKSKEQRMLGDNTVDIEQISKDNIDSILIGDEKTVINTITKIFEKEYSDLSSERRGYCRLLIKNSILVAKRLCGDDMTFKDLKEITWNVGDTARRYYVMQLKRKSTMPDGRPIPLDIQKENDELIDWFLNDYYAGSGGAKGAPKTWEKTGAVRLFFDQIVFDFNIKASNQQAVPIVQSTPPVAPISTKNVQDPFADLPAEFQLACGDVPKITEGWGFPRSVMSFDFLDDDIFSTRIEKIDMSLPFDENM